MVVLYFVTQRNLFRESLKCGWKQFFRFRVGSCNKVAFVTGLELESLLSGFKDGGNRCREQIEILKSKHFITKTMPRDLLRFPTPQMMNRIHIIEECGMERTCNNLLCVKRYYMMDIARLKKRKILDKSVDLTNKLLSLLEPFPFEQDALIPTEEALMDRLTRGKVYHRLKKRVKAETPWTPEELQRPQNSILDINLAILRQYYAWRLKVPLEEIDILLARYKVRRTSYRSLYNARRTFDILQHDLKIPTDKILGNFFLLLVCPEKLQQLVNDHSTVCNMPLSAVASVCYRVVTKTSEHITAVLKLFQEFHITDEQVRNCPDVLVLNAACIRERLERVRSHADLNPYWNSSRFLFLILHLSKVNSRLELLRSNNLNNVTLQTLCGSEGIFKGYLLEGTSKADNMCDVMRYIQYELCGTDREAKSRVMSTLARHSLRFYVPIRHIKTTLDFLRQLGFTRNVIVESADILLYPREKILRTLEQISVKASELEAFGFKNGFVDASPQFQCSARETDRRLAICLYFMEKEVHFTGEAAAAAEQ